MILGAFTGEEPKGKDKKKISLISSFIFIAPRRELYWKAKIAFLC
jgi:hypothetical protein